MKLSTFLSLIMESLCLDDVVGRALHGTRVSCFDASNKFVVLVSSSGSVVLFERVHGDLVGGAELLKHLANACVVKISPDDSCVALTSKGGAVLLLALPSARQLLFFDCVPGSESAVTSVEFGGADLLFLGFDDGRVEMLLRSKQSRSVVVQPAKDESVVQMSVSPSLKHVREKEKGEKKKKNQKNRAK
jgi:WD40 repeat protein